MPIILKALILLLTTLLFSFVVYFLTEKIFQVSDFDEMTKDVKLLIKVMKKVKKDEIVKKRNKDEDA